MNTVLLHRAIEQVKALYPPPEDRCRLCLRNPVEIPAETAIEIIGIPTEIGIPLCGICFDNLQIAVGEMSLEY